MDKLFRVRIWQFAAVATAMVALGVAAASVQRERSAKAKRLGVSIIALSNPDRLMKRLRVSGGL